MTTTDDPGNPIEYFHGGAAGLNVGDRIIPRGQLPFDSFDRHAVAGHQDPTDHQRVYFTGSQRIARAWAIRTANNPPHTEGWLYRVRPSSPADIEEDDDWPTETLSFSAPWCEIVEVVERRVPGGLKAGQRVLGPYMTWADGTPCYDRSGYMLPAPEWGGITARDLRQFGTWIQVDTIGYNAFDKRIRRVPKGQL